MILKRLPPHEKSVVKRELRDLAARTRSAALALKTRTPRDIETHLGPILLRLERLGE